MRSRLCLVAIFLILTSQLNFGQYYFYDDEYFDSPLVLEIGVSAGGMNCLTDLGGRNRKGSAFMVDVNWRNTRFTGSLYASLQYENIAGLRFEVAFGNVRAADSLLSGKHPDAYGRYQRNLQFQSPIREGLLALELYPFALPALSGNSPPACSPYIFGGMGIFTFRPHAIVQGTTVDLSLLRTEGQGFAEYPGRKMYTLRQWNLPAGIGIKYEKSAVTVLRMEFTYRKLWTDYLDDVSSSYVDPALFKKYLQPGKDDLARLAADRRLGIRSQAGHIRGNDRNNDAYFSFNLKLSFVLGRTKR